MGRIPKLLVLTRSMTPDQADALDRGGKGRGDRNGALGYAGAALHRDLWLLAGFAPDEDGVWRHDPAAARGWVEPFAPTVFNLALHKGMTQATIREAVARLRAHGLVE